MHIPDGFLDAKTAAAAGALAAVGLGAALRHARRSLEPKRVPLLGLSAAFVFAAQMLNFPVAGGTSGHVVGGVLVAALLGPSAAVIVLSAVLIVQCFMFADGGISALGANIFNMAMVGGVGGWAIFHLLSKLATGVRGRVIAAAVAAWSATLMASIACAGELATSNTVAWRIVFPAMAGVHSFIGVGEAMITALVLSAIARVRPDLFGAGNATSAANATGAISPGDSGAPRACGAGSLVVYGLAISIGLAMFVAPFASGWPDGLDRTAEVLGFSGSAAEVRAIPAPVVDYRMPGVGSEAIATGTAGLAGTVVVFVIAWVTARGVLRRKGVRFAEAG